MGHTHASRRLGSSWLILVGITLAAVLALGGQTRAASLAGYRFSATPLAPAGSIGAGGAVNVVLTPVDAGGNPTVVSAVYLSFSQTPGGGGARSGGVTLSSTPQRVATDQSGQITVTYNAPSPLPTSGTDTIVAQDAPTHPAVTAQDSYTFAAAGATAYTWSEQSTPAGCAAACSGAPPPRYDPAMAYDPATGTLVLFGGASQTGGTAMLGDTWTWNGSQWTKRTPAHSPSPRYGARLVYDPTTQSLLLFGGADASNQFFGDTWAWTGSDWIAIPTPTSSAPPPRYDASLAYDSASGQVLLFGGWNGASALGDTWVWQGTSWSAVHPAHSPSARYGAAMAYDAAAGSMVLFGGANGTTVHADTAVWNGTDWTFKAPAHVPPAASDAVMAYDQAEAAVVLFDGGSGTWTWNGTDWTQQQPASSPPAVGAAAADYVGSTNSLVLFGGEDAARILHNATWTWIAGTNVSPPTISTTSLPAATVGSAYAQQLGATGGVAPYTWSVASGSSPPPWLTLSPTGQLRGTPTAAGAVSVTVDVADARGETAVQTLSLTVNAPAVAAYVWSPTPVAATGTLPSGSVADLTLTAEDASGHAIVAAAVYVSFTPAPGGGSAFLVGGTAGSVALTPAPQRFTTDGSGQLHVTYDAPASLPAGGHDALTAQNAPASPTVSAQSTYTFIVPSAVTLQAAAPSVAAGTSLAFTGKVADAQGGPVSGATVDLTVAGGLVAQAVTGGDGTYQGSWVVPDAVGAQTLTASVMGAAATVQASTLVQVVAGPVGQLTMHATPAQVGAGGTVTVSGLAVDAFGNPVTSATISLTVSGGTLPAAQLVTNPDGSFTSTWTLPSTTGFAVATAAANGVTASATVGVRPGAVAVVALTPTAAGVGASGDLALNGKVSDAYGNPIPGAMVTLTASGGTISPSSATTNAAGTFGAVLAAPAVPGPVTLTAKVEGSSPLVAVSTQVTATATVTLAPSQTSTEPTGTVALTGTVTGAGGVPLAGVTVGLAASAGTVTPALPSTGGDGTYQAVLQAPATAGPVQVTATLPASAGPGAETVVTVGFAFPVVTSVTPNTGGPGGGDSVSIRGTGLSGATGVYFGTQPARFTANPDGSLAAQAPAGAGTVDVRVITEPVATDGLLLYYRAANADAAGNAGQGGSPGTIRDLTGNGDNGVLQNMDGAAGGGFVGDGSAQSPFALSFKGGGEVVGTQSSPLPGTLALDVWFRATHPGGQILGFASPGKVSSTLYLDGSGHLALYMDVYARRWGCLRPFECAAQDPVETISSPATYTDGHWHEAVATFAGSQLALCVDGQPVGNVGIAGATHPSWGTNGVWQLGGSVRGAQPGTTPATFSGQISTVRVYARALTAQELTANQQAGLEPAGGFSAPVSGDRYTYRVDLTGAEFSSGSVGAYYLGGIRAVSGVPPYTWAVVQGSLPPGLTFGPAIWSPSGSFAELSGTPKAMGPYAFTVQVTDSTGQVATQPVQLQIGLGSPAQVSLSATPSLVTPGGTATIRGLVEDDGGDPVPGAAVSLSAPQGTLAATSATTDANGRFSVGYTAPSATGVYQVVAGVPGSALTATATVADFTTSDMVLAAVSPARAGPGYTGLFTITGWGFRAGGSYSVTIGGETVPAQVVSSTQLQLAAPALDDGTYDVTVTGPDGGSQTLAGALSVTSSLPMGSAPPASSPLPTTPYLSFAGGMTGGDTLTVDGMTIQYGNLNVVNGNTAVLSAPILINGVLHYDGGQLTLATAADGAVTVSGSAGGTLYVDTNMSAYPKVYLYKGAFTLQAGGTIALPDLGMANQLLKIAGFSVDLTRLTVASHQVSLVGALDVLGAKADLSNFTVGSGGVTAVGSASLPDIKAAGVGIDDVHVTFDTTHGALNGQGTIALPMLSAGGQVALYNGHLQSFSVSIGNFSVNLPGTPVFVDHLSGGAADLQSPNWQLQSGAGFSAPYGEVGAAVPPPFTGGVNLTFTVGQSLTFNGQLILFGKFTLASVSGSVTQQEADLNAQVNAGPIANGNANLRLRYNPWYFHGAASATVNVPHFQIGWISICPCTLGGIGASIDSNSGITASVTVFRIPVTVGVGWNGRISVNGWYIDPATEQVTLTAPRSSVPLLGSMHLTGTVLDPSGHPVPGVTVELTSTLGSVVPDAVVTDARGAYTATLVAGTIKGTADVTTHVRGAAPSVSTTILVGVGEAADPVVDSTIVVPAGLSSAILAAKWQTGSAALTLVSPTGQTYSPANSAALYASVTDQNEALYNIPAPAAGSWTAEVSSSAPVGTVVTGLLTPLATPTISVSSAVLNGGTLTVRYSADTFNGQGTVNLYYNTADGTAGGTPFSIGLPTGKDRSVTWSPGASVPSGRYYVYGTVNDGVHPAASTGTLAPAPFTWTNMDTPAAPQGLAVAASNGQLAIDWQPAPAASDVNDYRLTVLTAGGGMVAAQDVGDVTSYTWSGLTVGQTYGVEVTAVSSRGVEGPPSTEVSLALPVPQPPSLSAVWSASDATDAGNLLVAATVGGANALTLFDNGSEISTTPAAGPGTFTLPVPLVPGGNSLRLTAVSATGDTTSTSDSVFYDPAPAALALTGRVWDGATLTAPTLPLSGVTDPGNTVRVNDQALPVSPLGTFLGTVTLQPGANAITVTASTPAGGDTVLQGTVTYTAQTAAPAAAPPPLTPPPPTQIGSTGGMLGTADGAFQMFVPAGSLAAGALLSVAEGPAGAPAGLSASLRAASPTFVLSGAALAQPATATIRFALAGAQAGLSRLRFSAYRLQADGKWRFIPSRVDATADTVAVSISGPTTLVVLADGHRFPDLPANGWSTPYVDRLLGASVIDGFPDGTFRPGAAVTRAQFVKMLLLTTGRPPAAPGAVSPFGDVPAGAWFTPYVAAAVKAGLVQGVSATRFAPDQTVTREQMAVLLARALGLNGRVALHFPDAGEIHPWAQAGVQAAVAAGYLNGFPDGSFGPDRPTTRAQAAKVLALAIQQMAP